MITNKTSNITFGEFQSWMTGLIEGKRGKLPDLEDWKLIKVMMDRVKPDVETVTVPNNVPNTTPYIPPYDNNPFHTPLPNPFGPNITPVMPDQIWCGSTTSGVVADTTVSVSDLQIAMESITKSKNMEL